MTREERDKAIRILQWLHDNYFLFRSTEEDVKYATKLAIQELQKEPCDDFISKRANCIHRHENGNCLVVGGFCTSVTDKYCPNCGAKMEGVK